MPHARDPAPGRGAPASLRQADLSSVGAGTEQPRRQNRPPVVTGENLSATEADAIPFAAFIAGQAIMATPGGADAIADHTARERTSIYDWSAEGSHHRSLKLESILAAPRSFQLAVAQAIAAHANARPPSAVPEHVRAARAVAMAAEAASKLPDARGTPTARRKVARDLLDAAHELEQLALPLGRPVPEEAP